MKSSFKNFAFIAAIGNEALMLALITVVPNTPLGKTLFGAFPDALSETMVPLPLSLIEGLRTFGHWKLMDALRDQSYPVLRLGHRTPQNDFDGALDKVPKGLTLPQLQTGAFEVDGVDWVVFAKESEHPYPHTNPGWIDRTFFCARKDLIGNR